MNHRCKVSAYCWLYSGGFLTGPELIFEKYLLNRPHLAFMKGLRPFKKNSPCIFERCKAYPPDKVKAESIWEGKLTKKVRMQSSGLTS